MHRPLKAIVIEDDPTLCRMFAEVLSSDPGIDSDQARTLAEGLVLCQAEKHLVLLVDLGLPDAHGTEAVPVLRKTVPGATLVVVTGSADLTDDALEAGAHAVIVKGSPESHGAGLVRTVRQAVINHENELLFVGAARALDRQGGRLEAAKKLLSALIVAGALTAWAHAEYERGVAAAELRGRNAGLALADLREPGPPPAGSYAVGL